MGCNSGSCWQQTDNEDALAARNSALCKALHKAEAMTDADHIGDI
jgi:hypothetical protein